MQERDPSTLPGAAPPGGDADPHEVYWAVLEAGGNFHDLVQALADHHLTKAETTELLCDHTPYPFVQGPPLAEYIVKALNAHSTEGDGGDE